MFPSNYVTEITDVKSVSRSDSKTSTGSLKKEETIKKGMVLVFFQMLHLYEQIND